MNKNNFNVCENPFNYIEVHANGDFTLCCPHRINNYTIGNFYKNQNFSEIWLGDKAIKFRESILDGSYKYCNLHLCDFRKNGKNTVKNHNFSSNCDFPLRVNFAYDKTCNVKCITCRDKQIITEQENMIFIDSLIDTTFIPMLKNAKMVSLNGGGEVFASKHMQKLIKEIIINYPNIKFNIQSNGIYFDKTHCDELGITKSIDSAYISIHAATKKVYDKVVRGGDYKKVINNIKWLSQLKNKKQIKFLQINFVVTSINYKDMIKFQELANKLQCNAYYTTFVRFNSELEKSYEELSIVEQSHPKHKQFTKILQNKIFDSPNCIMQNSLIELRKKYKKKTLIQKIKNYYTKE